MALHPLRNNFTGGEISPQLDGRIDLQKYETSCRRLENFRIRPYGGVTFRSGTLFIAQAKYHDRICRLIPFIYSTSIAYVLEMGENYIRFYRDGAQIESSPGVPYEIASNFVSSELYQVQFKQINDVMYLVHPNHPVFKLSRLADANWTTVNVAWTYPALMDENSDETKTLELDDLTAHASWATAQAYTVGNIVKEAGFLYRCLIAHTSGVFATDLAALKWVQIRTLKAVGHSPFVAAHVGSYWEIKNLRTAQSTQLDLSVTSGDYDSAGLQIVGDWQVVTTERWYGILKLQRSEDDGVTWNTIREWVSKSGRNVSVSGTEVAPAIGKPIPQLRLRYSALGDPYGVDTWEGTPPTTFVKAVGTLEVSDMYLTSLVVITAVTSSTFAEVAVFNEGLKDEPTSLWSEGAWSTYRGYPRSVSLFEQRLFFGGTATQPNTVWGSATADFENFRYGDEDDAAVAYRFASAQQNPIQWLETLLRLHVGTSGTEHTVTGGGGGLGDEPLTPSNVLVRDPTAYGSESLQAVKVENAILFLQRQGRRIRELRDYNPVSSNNDNQAEDLTLLAEHLTDAGISQITFGKVPDPTLYAVMGNGHMAVMCYNREQNVTGWSRYITSGSFESCTALPSSPADSVYVVVRRTIGGVSKRYIEAFTAERDDVPFSRVHSDSTVVYDGVATTTITGLSHLEGRQVAVVAGVSGYVVGDVETGVNVLTVSGGQITLPQAETFVRVGLQYRGWIKPTRFDALLASGTSQGRKKRISELAIHLSKTIGGNYGTNSIRLIAAGEQSTEIPLRSTEGNMDSAPSIFTGIVTMPWENGPEEDDRLQITQLQPLPMTVLGIFPKLEVFGE